MNKNNKKDTVFAADLGGTMVKGAIVNDQGKLLAEGDCKTEQELGATAVIANILALKEKLSQQAGGPALKAVGLGVAGYLESASGLIISSPNLPKLNGINLKEEFSKKSKETLLMDNDANCAALAESWLGSGKDIDNFIFITLGTGVGGGIIIGGHLFHGDGGRAGEIGHIIVQPGGYQCGCGSKGCLETISSKNGLKNLISEKKDSSWFKEKIADCNADDYPELIGQLVAAADKIATEILAQFTEALAIACAGILNTLDIRTFIFGGGISAMFKLFAKDLHRQIIKRVHGFPANKLNLQRASMGNKAGLLGAAKLALES